ncbi:hypothetical protein Val02_82010 [Virgisporangium aliadipatigenens]|uniref:Uncharacterized protein n=1 Tax=Virgisporangium aliadipatigenens TaxID=741659 RepID=A0A8J3YWW4_9ACTN|nr:hypothetical protein [Virgisporangium aliadipatigenens]GIJ51315.1 hypothetical protein Val02_82010 [Virgisporangium aliadipatigenens]
MRDSYANLLPVTSINPAARTATINGSTVDRYASGAMYQDALIIVHTGTITDGTHTITVEESDDNSAWATATSLVGTAPVIDNTGDNNKCFAVRYTGMKRYVRVRSAVAGATTGGVYGATVLLSDPRVMPAVQA